MTRRFPGVLPTFALAAFVFAALPARAEALDECWAKSVNRIELGECLRTLKEQVDSELEITIDRASAAQNKLDEVVGQRRSARALERSQMAFELYRNLECHVRELQAGSGTGSGDFFLGCWVDMTRDRILALQAITPKSQGEKLVGETWMVEDIEGRGVIDFLQSTLTFDSLEKVSGMGGCNNFFGSVEIDGSAMQFSPLGATRKACGEAIDDQELRFFQALAKVRSFEIDRGLLILLDDRGHQVLRLSRS